MHFAISRYLSIYISEAVVFSVRFYKLINRVCHAVKLFYHVWHIFHQWFLLKQLQLFHKIKKSHPPIKLCVGKTCFFVYPISLKYHILRLHDEENWNVCLQDKQVYMSFIHHSFSSLFVFYIFCWSFCLSVLFHDKKSS